MVRLVVCSVPREKPAYNETNEAQEQAGKAHQECILCDDYHSNGHQKGNNQKDEKKPTHAPELGIITALIPALYLL